ncbi:LysR family transcriptional regulator [Thermoleptolyngbya sichuanensis A183]|uniref:LysR family transcriptional regulator n=1 Tax=Thermoleptolyngbya sichuanensis A183 TaxID=2737172 RepID=A0A6M8BBN4_9CYAN|nr:MULTISPECIES: LysR family transcriptional regulator [Thermoleptolyngbya]MDG2615704.1 LysR family transcriptional regulator [Thermoleptolyngbya sichuanensis XZ-Cy5]QKD84739.1 LysR family transcriptional regulator [Thermoleptolyngbya sichuanensis A183]
MNIDQLRVFVTVAELGSFSTAALKLDVSQSSVSRAIAALEEELGVSLLTRGRFGAHPTQLGERVLVQAQQILQARERIDYEVNLARGLQGGRVRLASFRSAATHLLPPRIAQFCQRFPQIEVTLTEDDPLAVEQALREGAVDIGLVPLPRSEEFDTWEIGRDEFVVLLPPGRRSVPEPITWEVLSRMSFILYNYAECTSAVRDHWERWGQTLRVAYEVKEDSTIVSMVAQGLGAAILPRLAALPIPDGVQVRSLPVPLERVIGAAVLANVLHPPAVFVFLDALRGTGQFRQSAA